MNNTVRTGLVTASVLASLGALSASLVSGEGLARRADPPAAAAFLRRQAEVPASEEKRHQPPPPTLPTFTGVANIGRTRYRYTLVGTNPEVRRARNVVVPVLILPVRLQFSDGTVLDPTQPDTCMGGLVPLNVALQSPLFQDFDYGQGPRQFLEQVRRLEFWEFTAPGKLNPGYSVRLAPSVLPTQTLALSPASQITDVTCLASGEPEKMGHVDIVQDWGPYFSSQVVPQFPKLGVNAGTLLLLLLPNIDFTSGGTPILTAYHDAAPTRGGLVTYAVAQLGVVRPGLVVNIGALSHELAEWLDDPFVDNITPNWNDTGEGTPGCGQGLEVGDPLIGTFLPAIQMPNGVSYEAQETVFLWWFFNQPSLGFNGWYSSGGTVKSPSAPCH